MNQESPSGPAQKDARDIAISIGASQIKGAGRSAQRGQSLDAFMSAYSDLLARKASEQSIGPDRARDVVQQVWMTFIRAGRVFRYDRSTRRYFEKQQPLAMPLPTNAPRKRRKVGVERFTEEYTEILREDLRQMIGESSADTAPGLVDTGENETPHDAERPATPTLERHLCELATKLAAAERDRWLRRHWSIEPTVDADGQQRGWEHAAEGPRPDEIVGLSEKRRWQLEVFEQAFQQLRKEAPTEEKKLAFDLWRHVAGMKPHRVKNQTPKSSVPIEDEAGNEEEESEEALEAEETAVNERLALIDQYVKRVMRPRSAAADGAEPVPRPAGLTAADRSAFDAAMCRIKSKMAERVEELVKARNRQVGTSEEC